MDGDGFISHPPIKLCLTTFSVQKQSGTFGTKMWGCKGPMAELFVIVHGDTFLLMVYLHQCLECLAIPRSYVTSVGPVDDNKTAIRRRSINCYRFTAVSIVQDFLSGQLTSSA